MFRFNPFKKEKKPVEKGGVQKKSEARKEEKAATPAVSAKSGGGYPLGVLIAPHMAEKAARLNAEFNQYVFEVAEKANAYLIKRAVEGRYGVRVIKVNTLKNPGKKVRLGRQEGWRKGFKKAVVTLQKGQSIEFT